VIRLAHLRGIAVAVACRGPEIMNPSMVVFVIDRPDRIQEFLPELNETVPEARISLKDEEVLHLSPSDSLP